MPPPGEGERERAEHRGARELPREPADGAEVVDDHEAEAGVVLWRGRRVERAEPPHRGRGLLSPSPSSHKGVLAWDWALTVNIVPLFDIN